MTRILVIVPFALDAAGLANRQAQSAHVPLPEGWQLTYRPVACGPSSFMSPHDWGLMELAIFEAGSNAQAEGFDAVCIDTMSDGGMAALRSVLDIPVIGAGKASMLYALTLGARFSVLAQWDPALPRYRKVIRDYGFEGQCASVRSLGQPPDFANLLTGKEDEVFPRMRDIALRCIEEDGADVICLGSTTMHQAAEYLAAELPVPVVNPGPLSYKLIETFLALGLSHGRTAYPAPVEPRLELLHRMMRAGAEAEAGAGG